MINSKGIHYSSPQGLVHIESFPQSVSKVRKCPYQIAGHYTLSISALT